MTTHPVPALDRRRFLAAGAAAVAGLAGLPSVLQAADKDDPFGGFTLGMQSYTLRNFDLEPALKRIHDVGLRFAEFYQKHVPVTDNADAIKAVLKLCADYDIKPIAYGVQRFTKDHDANKAA
jgi:hypothetical protein